MRESLVQNYVPDFKLAENWCHITGAVAIDGAGWTPGWTAGWMSGCTAGCKAGWMAGCAAGCAASWNAGWKLSWDWNVCGVPWNWGWNGGSGNGCSWPYSENRNEKVNGIFH